MVQPIRTGTSQTDATGIIPARLGVGAATVGAADTAGRFAMPIFSLPRFEWLKDDSEDPRVLEWENLQKEIKEKGTLTLEEVKARYGL